MSDEIKQAIDEWHDMTPDAPKPTLDERKFKEFWVNVYIPTDRVFDCVAHTTLEQCNNDVFKEQIREQAVHVIEYAAIAEMQAEIERLHSIMTTGDRNWDNLIQENQKLREALEFYAGANDERTTEKPLVGNEPVPFGDRARKALEGKGVTTTCTPDKP